MADDLTLFSRFALTLGASEPALKLLISLLIGYPLLLLHRYTLYRKSPTLQHLFFVACGLSLGIFNNGSDVIHSIICVVVGWLTLVIASGTMASVIFANVFQMGYLLTGYYVTSTTSYDIKWTMPHCVLTLRLIALTWDMYDAAKDKSELSKDQAETALLERPSLLEVAAQTYFPASFLVGPQFPMRRYLDFVHGRLFSSHLPDSLSAGFRRCGLGLFFIAVFQLSSIWLKEEFLVSDDFDNLSFVSKCLYVGLWGKITLYKYNSCWLLAEGVCIISGLAYNGREADSGPERWDACKNIRLTHNEMATKFAHIIESFNVNTNVWIAKYVYKRMKFLNNRNLSTLSALLFLAVWHGFHTGYYACFTLEFLVTYFERSVETLLKRYPKFVALMDSPLVKPLRLVVMKLYVIVLFGYCLAPFVLLQSYRWWRFFKSTYFMGHLFFGGWFVYGHLVRMALDAVYGAPQRPAKPASAEAKAPVTSQPEAASKKTE